VDIYCAKSARDAFSDEDLEFFIDRVVHKLEPQAVELLLDSFPALRAAADQGLIGKEIGLYVYYITGDDDGVPEHANVPAYGLAYVGGDTVARDDGAKFCYMIGIDLSSLAKSDGDDPVRDPTTGKLVLERDGENMVEFENTLVHELFHAIMDDYNRAGMLGVTDVRNAGTAESDNASSRDSEDLYNDIHFPNWLIEGPHLPSRTPISTAMICSKCCVLSGKTRRPSRSSTIRTDCCTTISTSCRMTKLATSTWALPTMKRVSFRAAMNPAILRPYI